MQLIIENSKPADLAFNRPLLEAVGAVSTFHVVNWHEQPSPDEIAETYDGVIASGVPMKYPYRASDERAEAYEWTKWSSVPLFGVCLSHQIIGKLYGSPIKRNQEVEMGQSTVELLEQDDPLLIGLGPTLDTQTRHRASIAAPPAFLVLGETATCANVLMRHVTKPHYGAQFHPELSDDGLALIANFVALSEAATRNRIAA